MQGLRQWWDEASPRDQLALVLLAGCVALYVLFVAILQPVREMRDEQLRNNVAQQAALARVRSLAAQLIESKSSGAGEQQSVAIETIVQRSLAPNGLQVSAMNASGNTGVRLRFDEARFANLLDWLYDMEVNKGLLVKDLSVASSANSGVVSVNMRLHQE